MTGLVKLESRNWQHFGNKKSVSQNKICKTNKLQAISPQELNKIV